MKELRVLLVEDSEDDAGLVLAALRRGGYSPIYERVDTAEDMTAALDGAMWEIVLSDYRMPRFRGLEALAILREREPDTPFIVISGTIGEETAAQAMRAGANDYLMKNNLARLGPAVERELNEAKVRRERKRAEDALRIQNQIAQLLLTVPDDELYGEVLQVVLKALRSPYGIFGYIDKDGAFVCPSMTRDVWNKCDIPDKSIVLPRDRWGDSIWGRAIKESRTLLSNLPLSVPDGHIRIMRCLCVPLTHHGKIIGLIVAGNKDADYNKKDVALLQSVSSFVSPVLEARLQRDRQEALLRESEARLKAVLDSMITGVVVVDAEKHEVFDVNPAAAESSPPF
ncbi:GAF domain-containing protein, partial [Elusimicrobiota bacterium]